MKKQKSICISLLVMCVLITNAIAVFSFEAEDCPDGMVSYWKLDDASGTTAADSLGDNAGTLVNDPIWTSGQVEGALEFDGISSYVNLGTDVGDGLRSIELWFKSNNKHDANSPQTSLIYRNDPSEDNGMFGLHFSDGRLGFSVTHGTTDTNEIWSNNDVWEADTWYHVVGTIDPATDTQKVISSGTQSSWYGGIVIDDNNKIYTSEIYHSNGIFNIDASTGIQTALVTGSHFQDPWDFDIDISGNLIVADANWWWEGKIIKVDPNTGETKVISSAGSLVDPADLVVVKTESPGLKPGDIIVSDFNAALDSFSGIAPPGSGLIIKVDPVTGEQTTISSGDSLDVPWGITIDAEGYIIVTDQVQPSGGTPEVIRIDPVSGTQTVLSSGNMLVMPKGITIDSAGNILVADQQSGGKGAIIKIDATTGDQTVFASGGNIRSPSDVTIDKEGNLYITTTVEEGKLSVVKIEPAGGMKLYVNGVQQSQIDSSNAATDTNDETLVLGKNGLYDTNYFEGIIDEIAVYNRYLTSEEIQDHYDKGLTGEGYCKAPEVVDPCEGVSCGTNEKCVNGECVYVDPCKDVSCGTNEKCTDGKCVFVDPCENVECEANQECIDGTCRKIDPCRDLTCASDEECVMGKCEKIDKCKDVKCPDDEKCVEGKCIPKDLCRDVKCKQGYACLDGKCLKKVTKIESGISHDIGEASPPSIQIKRTNVGVAGEKSAEIIFDVVNMDMSHRMDGFILCRSPDNAVVSSSLSAGSGSGAQYISPRFTMDVGPSQRALSITLDSDSVGDVRSGCLIKYMPFKEVDGAKKFLKMSGTYTSKPTDSDYRIMRLDKTVSFVKKMKEIPKEQQKWEEENRGIKIEAPGFALLATLMGLGLALVMKRKQ